MHYHVVALVEPGTEDVGARVDELLAPYDTNREIEPYKEYITTRATGYSELDSMMRHYGTSDLHALAERMHDWRNCAGGVDENGLYALETSNPEGHWDYCIMPGDAWHRWPDYPTHVPPTELPPGLRPPYALVTARDGWVAKERFDHETLQFISHPCWEGYCAEALSGHRGYVIVSLDCHN